MVRRASYGLQRTAGSRAANVSAPLRCLFLGRRRSTQARRACAPQGAGCDRPTNHRRTLCRRTASLLHCKTVVRNARCGLQSTVGFRVARARAPLRWLSLGRRRSTLGCRAHALCRADCGQFAHRKRETTPAKNISLFAARSRCDVPAAASNAQPAFAWHDSERHCAAYLSGGGAARELAARAHHGALVVVATRTTSGYCTTGWPVSFGARLWCDVLAAASNVRPAFASQLHARHCGACLSEGGAARELAALACRAARVVVIERTCE